jgi:hypothetical protein
MKKTYQKPSITALGLLRSITKSVLTGGDDRGSGICSSLRP